MKAFSFGAIHIILFTIFVHAQTMQPDSVLRAKANKLAQDLAERVGLPGVAGSDAHQPAELCTVYTEIKASLDVDDILKALKKGLVKVPSIRKSIHF